MSRILLVEDEEHIAEGLVFNLRNWGYHVLHAATGEAALTHIAESEFDLVLLDLMLPDIGGLDVAARLRREGYLKPILMLTAKSQSGDKVAGLDAGADDYLTKPFDLDELHARIRGLLRREVWSRAQRAEPQPEAPVEAECDIGQWRVDFDEYLARHKDGREVKLTVKEAAILRLFASRPQHAISRDEFLKEVWGLSGEIETRTVDNFMRRLRQTLEEDPSQPQHIVSVRGVGYRFVP